MGINVDIYTKYHTDIQMDSSIWIPQNEISVKLSDAADLIANVVKHQFSRK